MNRYKIEEVYKELESLMNRKEEYENNIEILSKNKGELNHIGLYKDIYKIYFKDDLLPIIIDYYKTKIYELDKEIEKFTVEKLDK